MRHGAKVLDCNALHSAAPESWAVSPLTIRASRWAEMAGPLIAQTTQTTYFGKGRPLESAPNHGGITHHQ